MRAALLLSAAALLYLPAVGLGYGADDDAYRVLRAGRHWLHTGDYQSSRTPGYPVVEAAVGALDAMGGSRGVTLGTLAMTLVAVGAALSIARRLGVPDPPLVASLVALHPYVWANAATAMDHTWALGLWMAGWALLLKPRPVWAGLLLGLSIGARLTTLLAVGGVLAHTAWSRDRREAAIAAAVAGSVAVACIAFPAAEADWTLRFLQPAWMDDADVWAPAMWAGRWAYKSATFWGLLPTLALVLIAVRGWSGWQRLRPHADLLMLAAGLFVVYELLYLRYPLDRSYLMPTVPVVALAASVIASRRTLLLLAGLVGLSSILTVELARPDRPFAARSAEIGVWLGPGPVVDAVRVRHALHGCESVACWQERILGRSSPALHTRTLTPGRLDR